MSADGGEGPGRSSLDRIVGVAALALLLLECLLAVGFGSLIVMVSDPCHEDMCTDGLIDSGVMLGTLGQVVPAIVAVVWFVRRWLRAETVWFVPFVLSPVPVLLILVGAAIAQAGVP